MIGNQVIIGPKPMFSWTGWACWIARLAAWMGGSGLACWILPEGAQNMHLYLSPVV